MIPLTLGSIAEITGGRLSSEADAHATVTGFVEFDSRKIGPGGLFVALPGERVDGHDFAQAAIDKGAVGVLAAREVGVPAVIVPNGVSVVDAMSALAREVAHILVNDHGLTIVGVTGSAGKTSTKDLMNAVLSTDGITVAPPGSFNNEIGHPYTVLRCTPETKYLVAEMSARGIGHIAHLATIAPPRIGVELNVGSAHLGEFGSQENIAKAKGELVEALPSAANGGVAVLNADDPFVAGMAPRTDAKVVYYSAANPPAPGAQYYATDIQLDDVARASYVLHAPGADPQKVSLQVFGSHQVLNSLAAAAAAIESGIPAEQAARALSEHRAASAYRMDVQTRADGLTVINDSYNANPDSMRAGIAALAFTTSSRPDACAYAVLGEMGELGDNGLSAHRQLGVELAKYNVCNLIVVGEGPLCEALAKEAWAKGVAVDTAATTDDAAAIVEDLQSKAPVKDNVVLVKASNAAGLWRVAEKLLDTQPR